MHAGHVHTMYAMTNNVHVKMTFFSHELFRLIHDVASFAIISGLLIMCLTHNIYKCRKYPKQKNCSCQGKSLPISSRVARRDDAKKNTVHVTAQVIVIIQIMAFTTIAFSFDIQILCLKGNFIAVDRSVWITIILIPDEKMENANKLVIYHAGFFSSIHHKL